MSRIPQLASCAHHPGKNQTKHAHALQILEDNKFFTKCRKTWRLWNCLNLHIKSKTICVPPVHTWLILSGQRLIKGCQKFFFFGFGSDVTMKQRTSTWKLIWQYVLCSNSSLLCHIQFSIIAQSTCDVCCYCSKYIKRFFINIAILYQFKQG